MENEIIHDAFSDMDNGTDELYHYGRKGMKWYQNIFTSGRERSVKRRRAKNLKKARKAKAKKVEEAKKAAEEKANYEAEKRKAIETGSAADVLRFKGQLTANEMQYVSTRLNWERNMSDLQAKEVASGKAKADDIMSKVGKMTDHVNTGAKAWNTFANIYNAFSNKEVPLPKIDTNITSGNKQERMSIKDKIKDKAEKKAREKEVKNTSASDALKNWDKYSTEERSAIVKNLNMRKTVKGMADSEPSTSATTSESVTSKAKLPSDEVINRVTGQTGFSSSLKIKNNSYDNVVDYGKKYVNERFTTNTVKVDKDGNGFNFSPITVSSNKPLITNGKNYVNNFLDEN